MPFLPAIRSREVEWKNGGGFTREISAHPPGSGLRDFDWRVSLARITRDGPFSLFPDVDRIFAIVEGGGVRLERDGHPSIAMDTRSPLCAFPGEAPFFARLMDEPAVALNVMTRRGAVSASVTLVEVSDPIVFPTVRGVWLAIVLCGWTEIETQEGRQVLQTSDAWLGNGGPPLRLLVHAKVRMAFVHFL